MHNVIEELLYADSMDCPLLREAAIDFIQKNSKAVMKSDSFEKVLTTKTITKDIMLALAAAEDGNAPDGHERPRSINDMRMELYNKGLSIGGSREVLASRLME